MAMSSIFGSPLLLPKSSHTTSTFKPFTGVTQLNPASGVGGLTIECSSRPQKKATAHHRKTRPRKSQPWDIKRRPTVYPKLPELPPDWTLVSSSESAADVADADGGTAIETVLSAAS
ncbi:50S ribosomal protein 6, chloroplastic [Linum perenne]